MKYNNIAVTGVGLKLPMAENMQEFRNILAEKKDCIRKVPEERRKLLNLDNGIEYIEMGYMDGIEYFDHDFFGISSFEADMMSPQQRISLLLATTAIQDAGYSLQEFRGKRCGVFMSWATEEYNSKLLHTSSVSHIGSMASMSAGNISYYLDLRGGTSMYDSSCSSAIYAMHEACIKLMLGEIDYALVGGVTVYLTLLEAKEKNADILGLTSKDGRSRSFDDNACGVGLGEGGGFVLLKRKSDALKDHDHIYGVIESGVVTGDGGRCSSPTLPSAEGQSEVFDLAWKEIEPQRITEIEAHGIGTVIGDSVEAGSMIRSLEKAGINEKKVKVSSVKSNIGHLSYSAGVSSILKVLTSFEYGETYGIVHLQNPNKLVNFEDSPLELMKDTYTWGKDEKRLVGINAFGLNGTNLHLMVSNYTEESKTDTTFHPSVLKISARTESAFERYRESIIKYLKHTDKNINDAIYTLNTGRDDYQFRRMVYAHDKDELIDKLEMLSPVSGTKKCKVLFAMVYEGSNAIGQAEAEKVKEAFPGYGDIAAETGMPDGDFKYKMYFFMQAIGLNADSILADATSRKILDFAKGKCTKEQLQESFKTAQEADYSKMAAYLNNLSSDTEIIVLDFGHQNVLKQQVTNENVEIYSASSVSDFARMLVKCYNNGRTINYSALYGEQNYQRVPVPVYPFEKTVHWAKMKDVSAEAAKEKEITHVIESNEEKAKEITAGEERIQEIEGILEEILRKGLNLDTPIESDEDFFELGGNSILIQKMSGEFKERLGTKVNLYDIYEYETIERLAMHIYESEKND